MLRFNALALLAIDKEWIKAAAILGAFILAAVCVAVLSRTVLKRWVKRTHTTLDDVILGAVRGLTVWALVLAGGYYAAQEVSSELKEFVVWSALAKCFTIAWILLAVGTAVRVVTAVSQWRIQQAAHLGPEAVRDIATRVGFFRRLIAVGIMALGGVYILAVSGVNTSPILAGGAVGGVVIGIALQDTLSNVFAGFFLNIDRPVKIGDFIKIDGVQEGFVEDVGWRYTKVRLWANNLLIIPNNKLSQSIITNFNLPAAPLSIYVNCGVAYDSDLEQVERVAIRVAKEVQKATDGGDVSWVPTVRFQEFGDSAITFVTALRSLNVGARYMIHHEFVKALHRAFNKEGIEIPFPIRTVIIKDRGGEKPSLN